MLDAHSSARLSRLSQAFQRIRWNSLKITVEGAYPTTSGGGYITCFVRDPTDSPPTNPLEAVRWAMAQQHSADAKWYDSVVLSVGRCPDLLFTSVGDGARFSSPGTLYVVSKGGPAQVGTLTINFHWDVTLSEPTIEKEDGGNEKIISRNLYLPSPTAAGSSQLGPQLQLCIVTEPHPDPAQVGYRVVADEEIGLGVLNPGSYIASADFKSLSCAYSTGDPYVDLQITGFMVDDSHYLVAVYEVDGEFYTINKGPVAPIHGFSTSDWHSIQGAAGIYCMHGQEVEVFDGPGSLEPDLSLVFRPSGRATIPNGSSRRVRAPRTTVPDVQRTTIALSGEQ